MTLRVRVESSVGGEARSIFVSDTKAVFRTLSKIRRLKGLPSAQIEVILTDDFAERVNHYLAKYLGVTDAFSVERGHATTAAKNIPLTKDSSRIAIFFDSFLWPESHDNNSITRYLQLLTIAHELAHPLFSRARCQSGGLDNEPQVPETAPEIARMLARSLVDEYRAESVADTLGQTFVTETVAGVTRALSEWEAYGDEKIDWIDETFRSAYPAWPDTVQHYRVGEIDLISMWSFIQKSTYQALDALVRVQAVCDSDEEAPEPLSIERLASLPAVRLYITPGWFRFSETLRSAPVLPTMKEFRSVDDPIVREGAALFLDVWQRLGIEPVERPDSQLELRVSAPLR